MTDNIQEEIEDKIIDCINFGVIGSLVIFKPEEKGFEDYLAVERRGKYKEGEIYLKINSFITPTQGDLLIKDFSLNNFVKDEKFFMLFVYFDEVEQKINDCIWLIPSLELVDIADVIEPQESGLSESILRFQTSLDVEKEDKYSKFMIYAKDLGRFILEALENGGRFNFKKIGLKGKESVNLENLKDFLYDARKNTYASDSGVVDNPRLVGSKQLEFQKGIYAYRDIYFSGEKSFIGQEIIYQNAKPVWGMNYMGSQPGKMESFLKESLYKLARKCRLGQSCFYERRECKYQDQGQGDISNFSGEEQISPCPWSWYLHSLLS